MKFLKHGRTLIGRIYWGATDFCPLRNTQYEYSTLDNKFSRTSNWAPSELGRVGREQQRSIVVLWAERYEGKLRQRKQDRSARYNLSTSPCVLPASALESGR